MPKRLDWSRQSSVLSSLCSCRRWHIRTLRMRTRRWIATWLSNSCCRDWDLFVQLCVFASKFAPKTTSLTMEKLSLPKLIPSLRWKTCRKTRKLCRNSRSESIIGSKTSQKFWWKVNSCDARTIQADRKTSWSIGSDAELSSHSSFLTYKNVKFNGHFTACQSADLEWLRTGRKPTRKSRFATMKPATMPSSFKRWSSAVIHYTLTIRSQCRSPSWVCCRPCVSFIPFHNSTIIQRELQHLWLRYEMFVKIVGDYS